MAAHDQGLTPETTSDHFMAAAVAELRVIGSILREIKDVLVAGPKPVTPDLRSLDDVHVKEPTGKRK